MGWAILYAWFLPLVARGESYLLVPSRYTEEADPVEAMRMRAFRSDKNVDYWY